MAKIKKKRKRLRIGRFLIFLLILGLLSVGIYFLLDSKIQNIVVKGNIYLSEEEVINEAKLNNYPSFLKTTSYTIKKRLKKNNLIKEVKVSKTFYNKVIITIKEKKILYLDEQTNKIILEDKSKIENNYIAPILVNYIPNTKYNSFIKYMNKVDYNILREVSEITYSPTELDDGRFLLSMDDGNYVYLTLTKFHYLNYYDDMLPEFNGKKGILYLDSGNTFKIME